MKIFHTGRLHRELPHAVAARLNESVTAASTLELNLEGYETVFEWQEPVQLWHKGKCVFAGKVTDIRPRGEGLRAATAVTITNLLWQMDRLTLGQQLADLKAAADRTSALSGADGGMDWRGSQISAMASWQRLSASCGAQAAGWSVDGLSIGVEVSPDLPSVGRVLRRTGAVSMWTALRALQAANPGTILRVDYERGRVLIESAFAGEPLVWDTAVRVLSAAELTPRWADAITGVAVAVTYPRGTKLVQYPAAVQLGDEGVRLFTAGADNAAEAQRQANYILRQLPFYYTAASTLQNSGSVRVLAEDLEGSPIGRRLVLAGAGVSPLWAEGANIVSAAAWDLLGGGVDLTVGLSIGDPQYDEMALPDGGGEGSGGEGSWDQGGTTEESESSAETGTGSGGGVLEVHFTQPTEFEPKPFTKTFLLTLHWVSNVPASYALDVDGTVANYGDLTEARLELPWGTHHFRIIATSKANPADTAEDTGSYTYPKEPTPTQTGPTPPTQTGPTPPTQTGPTPPTETGGGCPCAEKWAELEVWKADVIRRLELLENMSCDCAAVIREEAARVANELHLTATVTATEVQQNENGTVKADTTVELTAGAVAADSQLYTTH